MMYKDVVKDFAQRTKKNLAAIDAQSQEKADVFEVTQLINSMLGLLVFPQQDYVAQIPPTPIQDLEKQGWVLPKVTGTYPQVSDLNQLVRYLRNSVAHFNLKFIGNSDDQIAGIRVWNEDRKGKKTWEAELTVLQLRSIAERFIDEINRL